MKKKLFILAFSSVLFLNSCEFSLINSAYNSATSTTEETSESTSVKEVDTDSVKKEVSNQVIQINVGSNEAQTNSITEAVSKVYDSVVVINAYSTNGYSSGSGVIIGESSDFSYIITCHHVIEGALSYEVTLSNNIIYEATLIGGDEVTDIAVLAIEETGLTKASFVSSMDEVKLGSDAIAIGNPLGILSNTVTVGVVSSVKRQITTSDGSVEELVQTDAAINSGNSGGGLFNINGEIIGIVSSKYSASGVEGLAFAVPADIALNVASELCDHGYVTGRYKLGITISDGTYMSGGGWYGGTRYQVVYISDVEEDGCAYGLLASDEIITAIAIDFKDESKKDLTLTDFESASEVNTFLNNSSLELGDVITFTIKQSYNGKEKDVEVTLTQYIYQA